MLGQRGLRWQTCGGSSSSSVGQKRGVVTTTRAFKRGGQNKQRPGFTNAPMPNYPLPPIDPSQTAPPPPQQQQPMAAPNNGGGAAFAPPPPQQQQQQAGYPSAAPPAQTQTLPRPGGAGPQQIPVAAPNTQQQQQQQPGWSTTMPPPPAPAQQQQINHGQQQQINPQMPVQPQQQGFTNQQPGFQGSTNPNPNNTWQQQTAPFNPQQQQQQQGGGGAFQTQPPPQQQQNNNLNGSGYVNAGGWQQGQNNNNNRGGGGGQQSWQQQGGFLPDAGSYLDNDKGGYMDGGGYMDQQSNNNGGGGFGAGAYINTPAQRGGWSQQGGSGYYKNNRQQQQQQQMDLSETGGYLNDPSWQPQQRNNRPGFTGFQNDGPGAWRDDYLLSQLDKKMPNNANNYPIDGWEEEYVVEEDLTPKFVNGKRVMVNSEIDASQVRVQDASKGDLGIMAFDTARETAVAQDVDVVMITPDADPPVVRLIAFSKYKYEMEKSAKQKQKASKGPEIKEVKLRPVTEKADYDTKVKQAQKFLSKGAKVKLTMTFSGREMRFKDQGKEMMLQLIEELSSSSKMEAPLALRPSNFSVTLVPLK